MASIWQACGGHFGVGGTSFFLHVSSDPGNQAWHTPPNPIRRPPDTQSVPSFLRPHPIGSGSRTPTSARGLCAPTTSGNSRSFLYISSIIAQNHWLIMPVRCVIRCRFTPCLPGVHQRRGDVRFAPEPARSPQGWEAAGYQSIAECVIRKIALVLTSPAPCACRPHLPGGQRMPHALYPASLASRTDPNSIRFAGLIRLAHRQVGLRHWPWLGCSSRGLAGQACP